MKKFLVVSIVLISFIMVTLAFAEKPDIARDVQIPQGKPTGTIAGKVISINKPEMTITVQNPTQGMEIKVTAVQMKKINVGDRVEVRYILKGGKAYAISIRKLPGMPN
jgi:hypothetical protein